MTSAIVDLKEFFSEDTWSRVIPALRQDRLVWAAVQDEKIRGAAKEKLGTVPEVWSPANLALILLDYKLQAADLRGMPHSLPDELVEHSDQLLAKLLAGEEIFPNLNNAVLIAIALRDRPEAWGEFGSSYLTHSALACLYGIIEQPARLVNMLPIEAAIHVIFANPLDRNEKLDLLENYLGKASDDERLAALNAIRTQNPQIAADLTLRLSKQFNTTSPTNSQSEKIDNGFTSKLGPPIDDLQSLIHLADFQQLAANPDDARQALDSARQAASKIHTTIALQTAQANVRAENPKEALSLWEEFAGEDSREASISLTQTLIDHGYFDEAEKLFKSLPIDEEISSQSLLASARIAAHRGELNKARVAAKQATELGILDRENPANDITLVRLLLKLNLNEEAIALASDQIQKNPNDAQAAYLLAKAYLQAGLPEQALSHAHISTALEPKNTELRRALATTLEVVEDWQQALNERETVLELDPEFNSSDHHALAACALAAGQPGRASEIAQKIIRFDAFDGQAQAIMGQALIELDNPAEGIQHIEKAVQLSPEQPQAWIALAGIHRQKGDLKKTQQILITASRAASESAEIHLALGDAYMADNAPTKALSSFRKAYELAESSDAQINPNIRVKIICTLGQSLLDLGHNDDAFHILEEAYQHSPAQAALAHIYAKSLIKLGRVKHALGPLSNAVENAPENLEILQDLALVQYETHTDLNEAESNLKFILSQEPHRALSKGLLAKILETNKKYQEALEMYNLALGTKLTKNLGWYKELALGLSRMALNQNQPDTALASLEMAWSKHPEVTELGRNLATVYVINQLPNKALQVGSSLVQANLADLEIVFWFIDLCLELNKPEQALKALKKAILVHPNEARLYLMQADLLMKLGKPKAAHKSFHRIAKLENSTSRELSVAADGLIELQDFEQAVFCLERALALGHTQATDLESKDKKGLLQKLYSKLAEAHASNHNHNAALSALEEAITIRPHDSQLEQKRATCLIELGQLDRAAAWIQAALDHAPNDPDLNLQAAVIQRSLGNLPEARDFARKSLGTPDHRNYFQAMLLDANLANSMVQTRSARKTLEISTPKPAQEDSDNTDLVAYFCLQGEQALALGEEIAAAEALTNALRLSPQHARALALRVRLRLRQGGLEDAAQTLEAALKTLGENSSQQSVETQIALALAALDCKAWSPAAYLFKEAIKAAPKEPRAYLELARTLVLRAEHQRLCQVLHISHHAPGDGILSKESYKQFEAVIINATKLLKAVRPHLEHPEEIQNVLSTWLARGQAAFRPSSDHAYALSELSPTPENQAAQIAALLNAEAHRSAAKLAEEIYPTRENKPIENPLLLAQIARALKEEEPEWASSAAQRALDMAVRKNIPGYPIFFALKALISHHIHDREALINSIQNLLAVWDDEPYWHTLAAETLLNQSNELENDASNAYAHQAVEFMEKAIKLEPLKAAHYKKLGQAHLLSKDTSQALDAFKRAAKLAPKDIEPNLSLANIFKAEGDARQANRHAKLAIEQSPNNPKALKLLAEVAIEKQKPAEALHHADTLLRDKAGDLDAMLLRAEALAQLNKPAEALIALETATARMLPTSDLLLKTVTLKRQVYGEKAALESLQNLADQYPNDLDIAFELAQLQAKRGQKEKAIQTAQNALNKGSEESSSEQRSRLHYQLGLLLRQGRQLDRAVDNLSLAIDLQSDWIEPYIELGRAYFERRQYDQALQTYEQAIRIAPTDPRAYHWAGVTLKDTNDYLNAEIMLRKAADLDPNDVSIQRKLAAVVALNLVHNPAEQVKSPIKTGKR